MLHEDPGGAQGEGKLGELGHQQKARKGEKWGNNPVRVSLNFKGCCYPKG